MPDRDTNLCTFCKNIGSGIHHKDNLFICDRCSGKMKPETVMEITEVWG